MSTRPVKPAKKEPTRSDLSESQEAFVAMILEEHAALIRHADQKRDQRLQPLLKEKGIPDGVSVKIERQKDGPAQFVYEAP